MQTTVMCLVRSADTRTLPGTGQTASCRPGPADVGRAAGYLVVAGHEPGREPARLADVDPDRAVVSASEPDRPGQRDDLLLAAGSDRPALALELARHDASRRPSSPGRAVPGARQGDPAASGDQYGRAGNCECVRSHDVSPSLLSNRLTRARLSRRLGCVASAAAAAAVSQRSGASGSSATIASGSAVARTNRR